LLYFRQNNTKAVIYTFRHITNNVIKMEEEYKIAVYVALPISAVKLLDQLTEKRQCTRSDLIREAIENYLQKETIIAEAEGKEAQ
jgi:hypothetical protein